MYLVIEGYGSKLKVENNLFVVEINDNKKEYSPLSLNGIYLNEFCSLTTSSIKLAVEHNIPIFLLNNIGKPIGMFWTQKSSNVKVRKAQEKYEDCFLGKKLVKCKILNQMYFLKSLYKSRSLIFDDADFLSAISKLDKIEGKIDKVRDKIMGVEGNVAKIYYEKLGFLIPKELNFIGREMHPPKDKVNALLSYGYGFLYSEIEKNSILSGLDPYTGFLHADKNNRFSLVLDLAELFKQVIVDRAIITLITQKRFNDKDFESVDNGVYLSQSGKRKLIEKLVERLDTKISYKNRELKFRQIMFEVCHDLVDFFVENKEFEGFVYRW